MPRSSAPRTTFLTALFAVLAAVGCGGLSGDSASAASEGGSESDGHAIYAITKADTAGYATAIFAAGCFWCSEKDFQELEGVHAVISGFVGGKEDHPTYEEVSWGKTSHTEGILVAYDPKLISYEELLRHFWVNHDPTTDDRQFCDWGKQYRPGIFYLDAEQKAAAEASRKWAREHAKFKEPILTEITPATTFWPAENYHQDFWKKSPTRYYSYRLGCGRDKRLDGLWGDTRKAVAKKSS